MIYKEQLTDPHWQKKRLEILQRDNWTCQMCGSTQKQLHVHHFTYKSKAMAWDAPNDDLVAWCCDCHFITHIKNLTGLESELISYCQCMIGLFSPYTESEKNFMKGFNKLILKYKK